MKKIIGLIGVFIIFQSFEYLATSSLLEQGDKTPLFTLKNHNNAVFNIAEFIGKNNLVIYFYPKDDTPGCTKEACRFRDDFEVFRDLDTLVIGVSSDSPESHRLFKEKYNLPFILLSDTDNTVRKLFGVEGLYTGKSPGRVTFVIDKNGVVQYVFDSASDIDEHVFSAQRVLVDLKN